MVNLAQAVVSAALIVIAIVYFQNYLGLEPC
jgi:disulfide bond formation protein DsbB